MNFITNIFFYLIRIFSWAFNRIMVFYVQKTMIIATMLLINKGKLRERSKWAYNNATPKVLSVMRLNKASRLTRKAAKRKIRQEAAREMRQELLNLQVDKITKAEA